MADQKRIYAEVVDASGARVWAEDGESVGALGECLRLHCDNGSGVGEPLLDAEAAVVLGEALLAFARAARGGAPAPLVPVGRLSVAVSRVVESGRGVKPAGADDGVLDSEVFAQALLDELAERECRGRERKRRGRGGRGGRSGSCGSGWCTGAGSWSR